MGKKQASAVSVIGRADGPTSIFLAGKLSGRQKMPIKRNVQQKLYEYRRRKMMRKIKAEPHNMEQVLEYAKTKWGYAEIRKDCHEYQEEYRQMRTSFILQYEPELLGDFSKLPELKSPTEDGLKEFMDQMEQRQKLAEEIPAELFDMDLHILEREKDGFSSKIIIEKRYRYIGGSASGNNKQMKNFRKIVRDIYLYYGVEQTDIENGTRRYKELVNTLAAR